jgi:dephospho-CoA kinase
MPVLGITGGIATGKSSFVEALRGHLPAALFDADATVHELLAGDPQIQAAIRESFGPEVLQPNGQPDRLKLRALVFQEPARRAQLEAILHPAVRERWQAQAAAHRAGGTQASLPASQSSSASDWLYVDIPLLFETAAQEHFDQVVVVACSAATQRARMRDKRALNEAIIENIIGAQHDLGQKMNLADHVIWNDSTVSCLDGQARLLAGWLRNYHV